MITLKNVDTIGECAFCLYGHEILHVIEKDDKKFKNAVLICETCLQELIEALSKFKKK